MVKTSDGIFGALKYDVVVLGDSHLMSCECVLASLIE